MGIMDIRAIYGSYCGYVGIMDKTMETTIMGYIGLGFRVTLVAECIQNGD